MSAGGSAELMAEEVDEFARLYTRSTWGIPVIDSEDEITVARRDHVARHALLEAGIGPAWCRWE